MELRQLEVLVATAEESRLHKAAARLRRTKPVVSAAIRKLEGEVGMALFETANGRQLHLTDAGDELVSYARRMISLRDQALAAVSEVRTTKKRIAVKSASRGGC
jgi:DNA-binding transcriptional LysR family regulator